MAKAIQLLDWACEQEKFFQKLSNRPTKNAIICMLQEHQETLNLRINALVLEDAELTAQQKEVTKHDQCTDDLVYHHLTLCEQLVQHNKTLIANRSGHKFFISYRLVASLTQLIVKVYTNWALNILYLQKAGSNYGSTTAKN